MHKSDHFLSCLTRAVRSSTSMMPVCPDMMTAFDHKESDATVACSAILAPSEYPIIMSPGWANVFISFAAVAILSDEYS